MSGQKLSGDWLSDCEINPVCLESGGMITIKVSFPQDVVITELAVAPEWFDHRVPVADLSAEAAMISFSAPSLPGLYSIYLEAKGFKCCYRVRCLVKPKGLAITRRNDCVDLLSPSEPQSETVLVRLGNGLTVERLWRQIVFPNGRIWVASIPDILFQLNGTAHMHFLSEDLGAAEGFGVVNLGEGNYQLDQPFPTIEAVALLYPGPFGEDVSYRC